VFEDEAKDVIVSRNGQWYQMLNRNQERLHCKRTSEREERKVWRGGDGGDNGKCSRVPRKTKIFLSRRELYFSAIDTNLLKCKLEMLIPKQEVGILHFQIPNQKCDSVSCF
jgi:hypothetical protein